MHIFIYLLHLWGLYEVYLEVERFFDGVPDETRTTMEIGVEVFFFRWIEAFFKTMVSPVRITAVSEAHGIFFWWADYWHTIDRRAVTCCRRPWQWVDLTSCYPFSRVWWWIYFTSFVFGCKMDVSFWETLS